MIPQVTILREQAPRIDLSDRTTLIHNLVLVHQIIVASEQLLVEAIEMSHGALREYYTKHLEEERKHEQWLADDLRDAGIDVNFFETSFEVMELVGAQYYQIKHVDPACLLGYIYVLEGFPAPIEQIERLEAIHGKELLRCARFHSEHDPAHGEDARNIMKKYINSEVRANAIYSQHKLNSIFRRLERHANH